MAAAQTPTAETAAPPPDGGPVIDSHHHLWDLSMRRHPWLAPDGGVTALGDLAYLRRDYLVDDFARDAAGSGVVGSVHVEALWDPARDPVEETAWLDSLPLRDGIAARCVAGCRLQDPRAGEILAAQAAHGRVAGIRQTLRWHPDPAQRWSAEKYWETEAWQRGLSLLPRHGFLLELLMNPWAAQDVARLAAGHPGLTIVVNHCGSPMDRDAAGIARWRDGLAAMGQQPNIHLKLSNFPRYLSAPVASAAHEVLDPCLAAFGAARCLWGSDYPVARRDTSYAAALALFRQGIAGLPAAEQRALLHDNAARLYRF